MKNIKLKKGVCPQRGCGKKVSEEYAGKDPPLGTSCEPCANSGKNTVFTEDHVDFPSKVKGTYSAGGEYDFSGTRVKVNGKVGEIVYYSASSAVVQFKGGRTATISLGYNKLLTIYENSWRR